MATFVHRLALALRLINSATGQPVQYIGASLYKDKKPIHPIVKNGSVVILLEENKEKSDFTLDINILGYEPKTVNVIFSKLDKQLPILDIPLLPNEKCPDRINLHFLDGVLPEITEIDAVRTGESPCLIREWDARKKLLTVFNPHRLNMDGICYALVDIDRESYEVFRIVKRVSDTVFKIDRPLQTEFKNYFPICPVVLGETYSDNRYMLRLPDDSSKPKWIVRRVCGETVSFETIDPTAKPPPDEAYGGDE